MKNNQNNFLLYFWFRMLRYWNFSSFYPFSIPQSSLIVQLTRLTMVLISNQSLSQLWYITSLIDFIHQKTSCVYCKLPFKGTLCQKYNYFIWLISFPWLQIYRYKPSNHLLFPRIVKNMVQPSDHLSPNNCYIYCQLGVTVHQNTITFCQFRVTKNS